MDKNKIIIIALIAIIAALLVGMVAMMPNTNKEDTKLTFKSNDTLTEGDSLKIMLTDVNGTTISNQTVNVTITDKDKSNSYYSVLTNENGIGTLKLDKSAGEYEVTISYGGNDGFNGCNATKKVTIKEEVVEAEPTSSSSQSSTTPRYTRDEHGTYDNVNNMYIDGQGEGMSKAEVQSAIEGIKRNGGMI